ncbi:MAG: PQQ-binding-like beta-propeller repeat protein, partial [Planctomycetota bacterium]
ATFTLGRMEGVDGSYVPDFGWRWRVTHEQRLADAAVTPAAAPASVVLEPGPLDWPSFRGNARNSRVHGARLRADWTAAPPTERWRIAIGPGWSSFAHVDGRLFTQEQRGEQELVVCYDAATGTEIWRHADTARFTEVVSGAGPRATPTFADGRIYTVGATGLMNCLDAATGERIWRRDLMAELDAPLPMWGFSASPLVVDGTVIVYAGGRDDYGLVAYDGASGAPAWHVAGSGMNFASAQPARITGVPLVLFTNQTGLLALEPASGTIQWRFTPDGWRGPPMVQPQVIGEDSVILPLGDGIGLARLDVERGPDGWSVADRWSSPRLRPSFNDFVHYEGHLYGFDQSNFTCVDAATGARRWRGGRYGFGQVVLLEDVGALLVTGESGEVVLLAADPGGLRELGRIEAALPGKTWNHPIVVGNRLFLRNGEEAACYELPVDETSGG